MCTFLGLQHTRTCRRAHIRTHAHTRLQHQQVLPHGCCCWDTLPGRRAVGTGHPCMDHCVARHLPCHSDDTLRQNNPIQHRGLTYAPKPCLHWGKIGWPLNTNASPCFQKQHNNALGRDMGSSLCSGARSDPSLRARPAIKCRSSFTSHPFGVVRWRCASLLLGSPQPALPTALP